MTTFDPGSPTGYDVTALHLEYTYGNGESIQKLFKDGKNRFFFYIKDRFWKMYDEVPLRGRQPARQLVPGGGDEAQRALRRGRPHSRRRPLQRPRAHRGRLAGRRSHLRAIDRSSEHLVGIVMVDKNTEANLAVAAHVQGGRPFRARPERREHHASNGVTDPNAARVGARRRLGQGQAQRHCTRR